MSCVVAVLLAPRAEEDPYGKDTPTVRVRELVEEGGQQEYTGQVKCMYMIPPTPLPPNSY